MSHYFALDSIIFMMSVVMVFDRTHFRKRNARFCETNLLNSRDVDRLRNILLACQQS
jgi:hypothetical protein